MKYCPKAICSKKTQTKERVKHLTVLDISKPLCVEENTACISHQKLNYFLHKYWQF